MCEYNSGMATEEQITASLEAIGQFSSGLANVSTDHDEYLAEAYLGAWEEDPEEPAAQWMERVLRLRKSIIKYWPRLLGVVK